ncbi:hypothetical protein M440DRAFT_225702 [Trichoderma longibrachiatum ATCC 18648]|uniref:Uncharacterized protein n=1 Tax=Trichoderma longibrachiatum ATCC 18648 TaxID=983965 RepID=A0A2T4CBS2_TRILO|nr:hypothetical protein M440DRAFT_225702 [Trichoderma longibrachiatum ATCC 18648]
MTPQKPDRISMILCTSIGVGGCDRAAWFLSRDVESSLKSKLVQPQPEGQTPHRSFALSSISWLLKLSILTFARVRTSLLQSGCPMTAYHICASRTAQHTSRRCATWTHGFVCPPCPLELLRKTKKRATLA